MGWGQIMSEYLKNKLNSDDSRNYGIDLLRIASMYMIVVIHILGGGGVLNNETSFLSRILDNSIYIIVLSCINCYGLISGYVGYREEEINHKVSSFFYLWIQVVFYGIIIILILMLTGLAEIGINDFIEVFLPITRNQYWYFTAYLK